MATIEYEDGRREEIQTCEEELDAEVLEGTWQTFRGNPRSPFRRIGTARLTEATEYTDRSYPNAGWWRKVKCEPQEVEITSNGYWVCWGFDGTVTDEHFPAMFGGVAYGACRKDGVGEKATHTVQAYLYGIAEAVRGPSTGPVELTLDEDVRSVPTFVSERGTQHYGLEVLVAE